MSQTTPDPVPPLGNREKALHRFNRRMLENDPEPTFDEDVAIRKRIQQLTDEELDELERRLSGRRKARHQAVADDRRRRKVQNRYRLAWASSFLLLFSAVLLFPEGTTRNVASVVLGAWSVLGFAWIIRPEGERDR